MFWILYCVNFFIVICGTLARELVFRGVHHWRFCYFVQATKDRRGSHQIGLVTVTRGIQDTPKRDKIEIDVVRAWGRKKRRTKGKGMRWDRERASGLGVQLGADVTAIERYRKPRDRFFSDGTLAVATGNTNESNACTELLDKNVITACFASIQKRETKLIHHRS